MRTFITVWLGQLVSTFGSRMTNFALIVWTWEVTGSATALGLVTVFTQLPSLAVALFAGALIDRSDRKVAIIVGDSIAALSTLAILLLAAVGQLQLWHLFLINGINGIFGEIQQLAYSASVSLMVPKQHYVRVSSMKSMLHYGPSILAPAFAGALYPITGLAGIAAIDLLTFAVGVSTVLLVKIPQPPRSEVTSEQPKLWHELTFGCRYIMARASLFGFFGLELLFWFAHDFGAVMHRSTILARTDGNAEVLGMVSAAAGIAGIIGAIALSWWGGPKHRIQGFLGSAIAVGISKTLFALGQSLSIWIPMQLSSSLNFPLLTSSSTAIWLEKIPPEVQGRVFAAQSFGLGVVSTVATAIAGPLADGFFEPAMQPGGALTPWFGSIFGTGPGSGMALLYAIASLVLILVGILGYRWPLVRQIEKSKI
ncbi:MFS transporter [Laspinema palackyanum]|uniref:MFS transporter n=1 Tax=Laspinema palackyanum TaxID=3231601 RepID=UPI00345D74C5|nr:MFS transporter [Laspinema sp. D2c]